MTPPRRRPPRHARTLPQAPLPHGRVDKSPLARRSLAARSPRTARTPGHCARTSRATSALRRHSLAAPSGPLRRGARGRMGMPPPFSAFHATPTRAGKPSSTPSRLAARAARHQEAVPGPGAGPSAHAGRGADVQQGANRPCREGDARHSGAQGGGHAASASYVLAAASPASAQRVHAGAALAASAAASAAASVRASAGASRVASGRPAGGQRAGRTGQHRKGQQRRLFTPQVLVRFHIAPLGIL